MRSLYHPAPEEMDLPAVLYALSDPTRLRILADLVSREESSCGAFNVAVPKSTLSHHLKVLRDAGIVRTRVEGTQRFVSVRRTDLDARFPGLLQAVLRAIHPV